MGFIHDINGVIRYFWVIDNALTEISEAEFCEKVSEIEQAALKAKAYDIVTGVSE